MMRLRLLVISLVFIGCLSASAVDRTPVQYEEDIRQAFKQEDWAGGKAMLDEADPLYGTLSVFCELQGRYYYHFQQYDLSRRYLILALRDDAANTHALELLVRVERETGHYATAIAHINSLLEYSPYNARLWREKIELYRMLGNEEEANRLLERLHLIYPDDAVVRKDVIYQEQLNYSAQRKVGNLAAQEKSLRDLLALDPTDVDSYYALANLMLRQGRREDALSVLAQGIASTKSARLKRKQKQILDEEKDATRERDSLLAVRTARLSATLTMDAIIGAERDKQTDPDVIAARKLQEVNDLIADAHYLQALNMLDEIDSLTSEPDIHEAATRRRITCYSLLAEKEQKRFMGMAIDSSYRYLKAKEPEKAVVLLDSVLVIDPKHNEAHYLHSLADERLHHYDSAIHHLAAYHPLPEEVWSTRRRYNTLEMRTFKNSLTAEYQFARRTSQDVINHTAFLNYQRSFDKPCTPKWTGTDELTFMAAYAGRESEAVAISEDSTVIYGGGTGVQLGAGWKHTFTTDWTLGIQGSWANQFFSRWMLMITAEQPLPHDFTLSEKISYRRLLDRNTNNGDNFHLLNIGIGASTNIEQWNLAASLDAYGMLIPITKPAANSLLPVTWAGPYFNGAIKAQYFPIDGDRSHVSMGVGVGNAPESNIFNTGMPLQFAHLNTYVSLGMYWVVCSHLALSLNVSDYTMGAQTKTAAVRNYLYINAAIQIVF